MTDEMKRFFECYPGTPNSYPDNSVHSRSTYRLDKAKEQASLPPVDVNVIVSYVNEFLEAIGMNEVEEPIMYLSEPENIDYEKIQNDYRLADQRDIVWMKFTEDGYLGVVATSNDINFDIPSSGSDYHKKKYNKWDYNTAGILVHQLGKKWDESFVLVFPLSGIPDGCTRGSLERAIGNYLIIEHKVPIIDFYSHNYPLSTGQGKGKDIEDKVYTDEVFFDMFPNSSPAEIENEMECWDGYDF